MTNAHNSLSIGDIDLFDENGRVRVYNDGDEVGTITAAGLADAARMDDDMLSQLGALYYAKEQYTDRSGGDDRGE